MKKDFLFSLLTVSLLFLGGGRLAPVYGANVTALPPHFVYLADIDPTILQEMRYAGPHNFIGRVIHGYLAPKCILTKAAAMALKQAQLQARQKGLTLKVYDCYRPQVAVEDFYRWSQQPYLQSMKAEFYPRISKEALFQLGYIARHSGHSRGSTVDLTLVPLEAPPSATYHVGQPLSPCYAPYAVRFHDNSIDMGTGYDCLDKLSHLDVPINPTAERHRLWLQQMMTSVGFKPYAYEWWHFMLQHEPFPNQYFDFPVQ